MKPITVEGLWALWGYGLRVGVLVLGVLAPSVAAFLTWRYRWEILGYPLAVLARVLRWAFRRPTNPRRRLCAGVVWPKTPHEIPSRSR